MTPCAMKYIPEEDIIVFEKIKNVISKLPDIDLGINEEGEKIVLSCHILARAVAKVFSLRCVDGYFLPNFCHSWVLSPNGHLIDIYPVGVIGGPIMMVKGDNPLLINSPARWHYKKVSTREISNGLFSKLSFRRSVRMVESCLRKF